MKVAIFGAGTMGSGIAQVFAAKGHTALLYLDGGYDPSCSGQMHGQQALCGNEPFLCLLSAYG